MRASTSWNGVPGGELGSADAKQWCIPWGYELNNISYNKKMFDKVEILSVAKIIADALKAVFDETSVSELFNGENQS
jgi:multiple sugar transport system substrate-binding protein